jgi:hypothetical protein
MRRPCAPAAVMPDRIHSAGFPWRPPSRRRLKVRCRSALRWMQAPRTRRPRHAPRPRPMSLEIARRVGDVSRATAVATSSRHQTSDALAGAAAAPSGAMGHVRRKHPRSSATLAAPAAGRSIATATVASPPRPIMAASCPGTHWRASRVASSMKFEVMGPTAPAAPGAIPATCTMVAQCLRRAAEARCRSSAKMRRLAHVESVWRTTGWRAPRIPCTFV